MAGVKSSNGVLQALQGKKRGSLEDRYKLGEALGRGGMGVVYKAYDTVMKREVALKTILDIDNQVTLDLFYKECGTLAGMVHPNIISIYDLGEFEQDGITKPFFVMPLLPGATLEQLIRENSPRLTIEGAVDIITQACRGLHAAHEMGLVHRDVKPSNIFVLTDGSVKLIDFGIARQAAANTQTTLKGTLPYLPPEQIQMKPPTAQGDQYSLGVVCYETLARRRPFRGSTEAELVESILHSTPPPISDLNPNVKYAISQVVNKALAKQPWHRFYTVKELGDALLKAYRGEPLEYFDPDKIKPRLERASSSFDEGDYEFASEMLSELENEGHLDQGISLLRRRIDQGMRQRRVKQLLDSATRYFEAGEYPLALRKIQESLELDPENTDALSMRNRIEKQRRERKIDEWIQLARRHLDNQAFRQAREALDNVLKIKPNDTAALSLLADVDRREKDFAKTREKKSTLYQAALQAWERGDVTSALSKLDVLLAIERENPDTDSERSGTYQSFYNKVRTEHDDLKNSLEEARRELSAENFQNALNICQQYLKKYPNHALFQALNFDVEERQRQKLSAFIAETDRHVEEEPDLNRRFSILEEAVKRYPDEKHFQSALKLVKDKRDLVNSIVDKARFYEERGQLNEALDQWQIVRSIHAGYPGLSFEIEHLQNRRDQQARQIARARSIEEIERYLDAGNYERALTTLRAAMAEFPDDAELPEIEKLVAKNSENAVQASHLLAQARELSEAERVEESVHLLRQARQLDSRNTVIRTVLVNSLLDLAKRKIESKERDAADALSREILEIQPDHAVAASLRNQLSDQKREELISACLAQARRLQREDDLAAALEQVRQGLQVDARDQRLLQLQMSLQRQIESRTPAIKSLAAAQTGGEVASLPAPAEQEADAAGTVFLNGAPTDAATLLMDGGKPPGPSLPLQMPTIVDESEDGATGAFSPPAPVEAPASNRRNLMIGVGTGAGVLLILLIVFLIGRIGKKAEPVAPPVASAVKAVVRSNPDGALILVDGNNCGTGNCQKELSPGSHKFEAQLNGYAMQPETLNISAGQPSIELTLTAQLPTLQILTNLNQATVQIDNGTPVPVQEGEYSEKNITNGDHTIIVKGEQYTGTFAFSAEPGKAAELRPIVRQQQRVSITIVSALGSNAKILSTANGGAVSIESNSQGKITNSELALNNLKPGQVELTVTPQSGPAERLQIQSGPLPSVVAYIGIDKDLGNLKIEVGEDGATVYIDGKKQKRTTLHGIYSGSIAPGSHKIRVEKDGFQPVDEQTVDVKAGQETKLSFQLVAVPTTAALTVHSIDGAEVFIDEQRAGAVGDGSFSGELRPGSHNITVRKDGFKPHSVTVNAVAGTPVKIEAPLQAATGALKIQVTPTDAHVSIRRDGEEARPVTESTVSPLPEGHYTISASALGYDDGSTSANVVAGSTVSVNLTLNKMVVKKPEVLKGLTSIDLEKVGFNKEDKYFTRRGGGNVLLSPSMSTGTCSFDAYIHNGKRIEWYVNYKDEKNYVHFQLEDGALVITTVNTGRKSTNRKLFDFKRDTWASIVMNVSENSVKVMVTQGDKNLDESITGKAGGQFGFRIPGRDELQVAHLQFGPSK